MIEGGEGEGVLKMITTHNNYRQLRMVITISRRKITSQIPDTIGRHCTHKTRLTLASRQLKDNLAER